KEIKRPATLKEVEICSRSGLLATDKCYDAVKSATGDTVQKRTTYVDVATQSQMPTEPCNVHGEPRTRIVADAPTGEAEAPRAQLAADLSELRPIALKSPTLLTENDPYNSIKATVKLESTDEPPVAEAVPAEKVDNPETPEVRSRSTNE